MLDGSVSIVVPAAVRSPLATQYVTYTTNIKSSCTNRSNPSAWNTLSTCKTRILELFWSPNGGVGVKLSAMKFLQRVILVQTRGISDPRVVLLQHNSSEYVSEISCANSAASEQERPEHCYVSGGPSIHLRLEVGT